MRPVRLILVGGFLGAGKTTLLRATASRLLRRGLRVGLVTNDQASQLVDTGVLLGAGNVVEEVAGGCFCCRFEDLVASVHRLARTLEPDVVLCEPVGSCTDLSATVLQPLKDLYGDRFRVAPFTVLVEPRRALDLGRQPDGIALPVSVGHILRSQLEEADVVMVSKHDQLEPGAWTELCAVLERVAPGRALLPASPLTGAGVERWLELVLDDHPGGLHLAEVDYELYAEGEAALGWLNATARAEGPPRHGWPAACEALLRTLRGRCAAQSAEVAHVKLLVSGSGGLLSAHLTSTAGEPRVVVHGTLPSGPATVTVNARVTLEPDALRRAVVDALASEEVGMRAHLVEVESFRPAPPRPTHRYVEAVTA